MLTIQCVSEKISRALVRNWRKKLEQRWKPPGNLPVKEETAEIKDEPDEI